MDFVRSTPVPYAAAYFSFKSPAFAASSTIESHEVSTTDRSDIVRRSPTHRVRGSHYSRLPRGFIALDNKYNSINNIRFALRPPGASVATSDEPPIELDRNSERRTTAMFRVPDERIPRTSCSTAVFVGPCLDTLRQPMTSDDDDAFAAEVEGGVMVDCNSIRWALVRWSGACERACKGYRRPDRCRMMYERSDNETELTGRHIIRRIRITWQESVCFFFIKEQTFLLKWGWYFRRLLVACARLHCLFRAVDDIFIILK